MFDYHSQSIVASLSHIASCITNLVLFHSFICAVTDLNDFIVWDPRSFEQLVHTRMPFPLSTLYSIDECLVAARSGHLLFLLPSSSDVPSLEEKASSPCHEKRDECQPLVVKEVPKEAKEAMKEEVKEAREEKKEEVKVAKKEEPTITNKNTAATTEHTAETSIPTHPTETTSAFFVRESDKGREVEGSLLGRRSLVYSQHLSSLRISPSARCSSLTRECREYLKKLPPRSIEAENTEEYLLSNRMLGLALFNEEDIEKYDRLARQRRQESVAAEQEISATLRQKLSQLTHTCVIDDAEHALMGADRPGSCEFKIGGKGDIPPPVPRRESVREANDGSVVANPLLKTLFSQGKEQRKSRTPSEEDLGLFDVTNYYSIDEIAELCEHSAKNQRRKDLPELPVSRSQKPVDGYSRLCLTTRRQSLLKKLFLNTMTDNEEYRCVARMVSRLMRKRKGYEDLSDSLNTPENLAKLRSCLQSLNMTFEEIDQILGDESD